MKDKLAVSFSGGRTSAFMARWLQLNVSDRYDLLYIFANTGCEHERTLEFVQECDEAWNLDVHWVEAVVHHGKAKSNTHRFVDFKTASRNGEPFERSISKYGIPNAAYPNCTDKTKLHPMESARRELGFHKCHVAVGIRADEFDRMSKNAKRDRVVYPLVQWQPTNEDEIKEWWSRQSFDLGIPEHYGNCTWCWKKSLRKHLTLITETPEVFDFPERIEGIHADSGPGDGGRTFFRKKLTVQDIRDRAKQPFEPFIDGMVIQPGLFGPLDEAGGCSESCDIYAD